MARKRPDPATLAAPAVQHNAQPRGSRRGKKRIPPLAERAYYTRPEVCTIFGLSAKRLAEAINSDSALPCLWNGKIQIFPKEKFKEWFELAASRRKNIHAA
jgi:hypothetical protein